MKTVIISFLTIFYLMVPSVMAVDSDEIQLMTSTMTIMQLHDTMRMLWENHIGYNRIVINAIVAGSPDLNPNIERLLRNQDDIGNAIKPFYGDEAGDELAMLLRAYVQTAGDLVMAIKKGNVAAVGGLQKKWHQNADDIATFLSNANPYWEMQTMKDMLDTHLALTHQEAIARLRMDWTGDVEAFNKGELHILRMADTLTTGIIMQFPDKFRMGVLSYR